MKVVRKSQKSVEEEFGLPAGSLCGPHVNSEAVQAEPFYTLEFTPTETQPIPDEERKDIP